MSTPNIFTNSAPTQSHTAVSSGMDGAQQTEGETLFQQASQSRQPEVLVKRQFEQRNQNQKSKLANEFVASAGREGISQLAATPDGQHALAVVYDHAGSDGRGMMRQAHEEQGTTAVDYTGKEAETGKEMDSGSVSLQSSAPKSKHNQQLVELINSRSAEMGLSINLSDQASPAEINQASETINSVIKYDQQTFGTVLTTEKMSLLNEYIEQQNSDLPPIAYSGDEQKYAPIKPIIEKIDQLKSESNHENGFFDRLDQNINKSATFKPLIQSQSTGQPVVDALIATSDAILNLPTTAANLALVTANSPAIVLSAATGDSLEKTEMDIIGAAMSVSPQLEGLAQLSTVRRAIGLTTTNTTSLSSSRLSEGGRKVSDFLEKSFAGRLKRDGDTTIQTEKVNSQTELKIDTGSGQVTDAEGVVAHNAASLNADESATMQGSASVLNRNRTVISSTVEQKILFGNRVINGNGVPTNRVRGGHSPKINNSHENYAVEVLQSNFDGTQVIKFFTQFPDGNLSKIKKSTVFPINWNDRDILNAVKKIGDTDPIVMRINDRSSLHRGVVNGIELEVIKIGDHVTSGYPTGGNSTPLDRF